MLLQRILSATIGILYIIFMLYFGGWFFKISVLIMALILMHEFYNALIKKGYRPVKWLGYIFMLLLLYTNFISLRSNTVIITALMTLAGLIIPVLKGETSIIDIMVSIFAALYPGMMIIFLIPLAFQSHPYGMNLLILTLLVTWSTDTFAYFVGKSFGKRKLCPSISPNKTIEGSLGGLIGSIVVGIIYGTVLKYRLTISINLYHFGIIGLLGGVLSQLGDLCASSIKRFCDIKDFGKLMPGHGGLLDRFDSLLFTLPAVYIYYLTFLTQ
ncbi:MAG: phosphatidate cytidylyltransferase [Clostridiales bacterium]|nr:phosphatidate cytidylyltransferase [Clostridiales bacterium]